MYKRILVPMDGSEFSECSLAHVRAIASGRNVPEVVVMRVVEPLSSQDVSAYALAGGDWLAKAEALRETEARDYLSQMESKLKKEGLPVKTELLHGRAAEEILDYVKKHPVDLIIMSTHGRSGVSRWAFGSVTDRVVRYSPVPVLTVSPAGCRVEAPG
ncbi:MAG: universal stress protein [Dehalococcoidales bacterium]|nr:universal stress protein [Dehalococcoidales bacterium]